MKKLVFILIVTIGIQSLANPRLIRQIIRNNKNISRIILGCERNMHSKSEVMEELDPNLNFALEHYIKQNNFNSAEIIRMVKQDPQVAKIFTSIILDHVDLYQYVFPAIIGAYPEAAELFAEKILAKEKKLNEYLVCDLAAIIKHGKDSGKLIAKKMLNDPGYRNYINSIVHYDPSLAEMLMFGNEIQAQSSIPHKLGDQGVKFKFPDAVECYNKVMGRPGILSLPFSAMVLFLTLVCSFRIDSEVVFVLGWFGIMVEFFARPVHFASYFSYKVGETMLKKIILEEGGYGVVRALIVLSCCLCGIYLYACDVRKSYETQLKDIFANDNNYAAFSNFTVSNINYVNEEGETALIVASSLGHERVVRLLIKLGADVNIKDNYGRTALIAALKEGHLEIAKMLINAGADLNIDVGVFEKVTPLTIAAENGYAEIVRFLLSKGATIGRDRAIEVSVNKEIKELLLKHIEGQYAH